MKRKTTTPRLSGIKAKLPAARARRKSGRKAAPFVLMIGHSTRTLEEFIGLLQAHGATCVADVRTVPRSLHNPHRSLIADALLIRGIRSEDISSATRRAVHTLTPFAKVRGTTITYPAPAASRTAKQPPVKRSRIHDATGMNIKKRSPRS